MAPSLDPRTESVTMGIVIALIVLVPMLASRMHLGAPIRIAE